MSKTPTIRAMKARMVLKLRRPMLQEPSTRSTMSACAVVLHVTSERAKFQCLNLSKLRASKKIVHVQLSTTQNSVCGDCNDVRHTQRGEIGKGKKERRVL